MGPTSDVDDFLNEKSDPNRITTADILAPSTPPEIKTKNIGKSKWKRTYVRPQGLDISDKMLPPITRKLTATYEMIQDSKYDSRIIEGDKAIQPPPTDLPPTYAFFDSGEPDFSRANKMMKNVVRSSVRQVRQADGQMKPQVEEEYAYVEFIAGQKIVNIQKEYMLYAFLELHPLNESNKFRDTGKKAWFRRTDFDYKSTHVQMLQLDLQDEAVKYVLSLNTQELINLASAMFNPTIPTINVAPNEIKYALRLRARNNPEEVLFKSPDKKASKRIDVLHALEMGILEYLPERNSFFLTGEDRNPIFVCAMDANPLEDIAKHLSTEDGQDDYQAIMEFVNFWK
jgi:hypothetical protein